MPRIFNSLPMQVAAVCFRRTGAIVEFLLVKTSGGNKWTFPKGSPEPRLSHSRAAEREAAEEAGALGSIESMHFHLYVHSKGMYGHSNGLQETVVKAFLMEIHELSSPEESQRHPTWFSPEEARLRLAKGRDVPYALELAQVIDHALERINLHSYAWDPNAEGRSDRSVAES